MAELTKYLKLKIAADLSADAKYNLNSIDALGSVFSLDNTGSANIKTAGNITLEPQAPSLGGIANTGIVTFGTVANYVAGIVANSLSFKLQSPLSIRNGTTPTDTYLNLASIQGQNSNYTLTFDTVSSDKDISFPLSGAVVVTSGSQVLTSKSINADSNTLTNVRNSNIATDADINYSKLELTNSITNTDIASGAAIADTKLATITTPGKVSGSAVTSGTIGGSTAVNTTGNITAGNVTLTGDIGVNGGDITTTATAFNLLNTTATTLNIGGAATSLSLGATTGTATIKNPTLVGSSTTQTIFNTVATTINFAGAATSLNIGSSTAASTHNIGAGATISGSTKTLNVGTGGASGSTTSINLGPTSGNGTITLNKTVKLSALSSVGIVHTDGTGILSTSPVSLTADVSGLLPISSGGTNASTVEDAIENLLPAYSTNNGKVLGLNVLGTALEWKNAGTGVVDTISVSSPLAIDNTIPSLPAITIAQATTSASGYLSSADWNTFNSKQAAITGGASTITSSNLTTSRALVSDGSGKVAVSSVTSTQLGYVAGVTSAIQTQLNGKEPLIALGTTTQYWRGDKTWYSPVIDSTAGNETDQAASVSAMKSYISAQGGGAVSYTWSTADGATKSITHSLNRATTTITIYDENGEDILVDTVDRTSNNAVTLTSSVAPTGNWTVVIR